MSVEIGPNGKPYAFHDFPADHFPFTITAFAPDGRVIWEETMQEGPGILEIPGTGPGSVDYVEIRFANGMVHRS